ncbi:MAG: hypothetical protein AABW89_05560 [Nanoarchaeota archaeon]
MPTCGLINLGSCLPQVFFEFITNLINEPIQPFLQLTLNLLSESVNITLFAHLWAIIVYILSMFYALLIVGSGFSILIAGYDSEKREQAKVWLRSIIIMIILVQSSFFAYQLIIDLSSAMASAILSLIDPNFFTITVNSTIGLGLILFFNLCYLATLILTMLILILRYAIVSIGVVFLPIGIFFYFLSPLKQFGSLIINILGVSIFITFFDAILLIGFSTLTSVALFNTFQILLLITAFLTIDILALILMFFTISKATFNIYSNIKRWRN